MKLFAWIYIATWVTATGLYSRTFHSQAALKVFMAKCPDYCSDWKIEIREVPYAED